MKKSTLLALSVLVACGGAVAWAVAYPSAQPAPLAVPSAETDETTLALSVTEGEWVDISGSGNFTRGWRSNTTPQVSLICDVSKNNMKRGGDVFELHSGRGVDAINYTLSVADGWTITGVSFDYKNLGSAATTLGFNGKTYDGTSDYQKVEAAGLEVGSLKLAVNDSNNGLVLDNLKVTVKEGEAPADPDTPVAPPSQEAVYEAFKPSSLDGDAFAGNTNWYVMTIGSNHLTIADNEDADFIALNAHEMSKNDNMLWCIVGSDATGYKLYNKAAGTGKMLAAPKEMKGTTGAESYAILKAPGDDSYCYDWDFSPSSDLASTVSYYVNQHGEPAKKLNNRATKLAFWHGGADAGSSISFIAVDNVPVKPDTLKAPYIFPVTGTGFYSIQYRIPAIAVVGAGKHAGRIIAMNDYRYSGADIGMGNNGRIDQHITWSDDGGVTWTFPDVLRDADGKPVSQAKGDHPEKSEPYKYADNAFSDPCMVADRESGRILAMSCAGTMGFWASRRNSPQLVARWYSEDGGDTWSKADYDVTEQLFKPLDGKAYEGQGADGFFIGSGKIHQSRHVKVGDYYRLYCAISTHCQGQRTKNYVYYSDDFGRNWNLLGDGATGAVDSNGDEPKVEELPDGSVAIIARGNGGNRNYNIFTFTDIKAAEGSWDNYVNRNLMGMNLNACNGEPLMVPAIEKATGEKMYVLLQSVPFGPGRTNVGIFWKKIADVSDCGTPARLADGWDGKFPVSSMGSAYSTMAQMLDGNIAFLYEEETFGRAYTGVFRKFSLSEITGGAFEYTPDPDGAISAELAKDMDLLFEKNSAGLRAILETEPKYVGHLSPAVQAKVAPLIENYLETRDAATLEEINGILAAADIIGITEGPTYRMINTERTPTRYMSLDSQGQVNAIGRASSACDFRFVAVDPAGRASKSLDKFYIQHVKTGRYIGATGATETRIPTVEDIADAAVYSSIVTTEGHTTLMCDDSTAGYNCLHLAGDNSRVVPWTTAATSPASGWYVAPDNIEDATVTGIDEVTVAPSQEADEMFFDIYGRPVATPARGQMIITSKGRKFILR